MGEGASAGRLEDAWHRGFSDVLGLLPDHSGQFRLASAYLRPRPQPPGRTRTQRMRNGTRMALHLGVCELSTEHLERGGLSADELAASITRQGFRRVVLPVPRNRLWRGRPALPVVDAAFERAGP